MMAKSIKAKVIDSIIFSGGFTGRTITPEMSFSHDLNFDDLDLVEAVMELESAFGIEIPDAVAEKFETVQDAIDAVSQRLA